MNENDPLQWGGGAEKADIGDVFIGDQAAGGAGGSGVIDHRAEEFFLRGGHVMPCGGGGASAVNPGYDILTWA